MLKHEERIAALPKQKGADKKGTKAEAMPHTDISVRAMVSCLLAREAAKSSVDMNFLLNERL